MSKKKYRVIYDLPKWSNKREGSFDVSIPLSKKDAKAHFNIHKESKLLVKVIKVKETKDDTK